ncbi:hypothetical protein [Pseudomonas knackmussii]|uniref:hypothetical protein n=1 Tax=Pseudomonas knackmussii TaxID=65741 RepID=UPI003F4A18BB
MNRYKQLALLLGLWLVLPAAHAERSMATLPDGKTYLTLLGQEDIQTGMKVIREGMSHKGVSADLSHCAPMVDVPAGVADGDHSYGTVCDTGGEPYDKLFVCADVMVGHLVLKRLFVNPGPASPARVAQEVAENCVGG